MNDDYSEVEALVESLIPMSEVTGSNPVDSSSQ
jgi:hypothetical protein